MAIERMMPTLKVLLEVRWNLLCVRRSHDSEHKRQTEERLSSLETTAWDAMKRQLPFGPMDLCYGSHGIEPSTEDGQQEKADASACYCAGGLEDPALEPEGVCAVEMKKGQHLALCEEHGGVHVHVHAMGYLIHVVV